MLPSPSAAESTMVSPDWATSAGGPGVDARCGLILPQSVAAYDSESSLAVGTATKFGSALYRKRSAYASFFASTSKCQYLGFVGPREASVSPGAQRGTQA